MMPSRDVKAGMARGLLLAGLVADGGVARADMTLTADGVSQGLSLTTFATGFPNSNAVGPLGIAFTGGRVLVSDYPGDVRIFATDADNQTAASAPISQNYGGANAVGPAQVGGAIYMTR